MVSDLNAENKKIGPLVYWIASIFAISLDHKGAEGGSISVYIVLALVLGLLCAQFCFKKTWGRRELMILGVIFVPILWSLPARLVNHYEWRSLAATSVGYVLFGLSFVFTNQVVRYGTPLLKNVLFVSIVIRLLFVAGNFLANGAPKNDSGFVESEYGLKPGEFVLLGSLWLFFCIDKGVCSYRSMFLFLVMVAISIGMNQRINWILLFLFLIIFFLKVRFSLLDFARVIGSVLCMQILADVFLGMNILVTMKRFLVIDNIGAAAVPYGIEPSVMWRIAEVTSQLKLVFSDSISMLFGNGLGAPYGSGLDLFDETLGRYKVKNAVSYIGHNFWIYSIFANGLLVGLVYPLGLLVLLKKSLNAIRGAVRGDEVFACVFWISIFVSTISASPLSSRYAAFIAGVALSLFLAQIESNAQNRRVELSYGGS